MPKEFHGQAHHHESTKLAIVVARYNVHVTQRLLDGALARLSEANVPEDAIEVAWVPGAWELPLAVERMAQTATYDAVIALGCVIQGETTHDVHINRQVSLALGEMARRWKLPVLFGLLTCHSLDQAMQRAGGTHGNKGSECAEAALEMIDLLRQLPPPP